MTIGEKIKIIRSFRKLTQAELGEKLSLSDSRVRDYESGRRTPKEEKLKEIAKSLKASYTALCPYHYDRKDDVIETLFWLEESFAMDTIDLFGFEKVYDNWQKKLKEPWKYGAKLNVYDPDFHDDYAEQLINNKRVNPIGITINNRHINNCLKEWFLRKQELEYGKITEEEYFEWKINWPESTDNCGTREPLVNWRKSGRNVTPE